MDYKYKVFISYRREDAVFKDTVYNILSEYIDEDRIFVDKKDLYNEPNEWAQSLDEALRTSEYIVICINKFTFVREPQKGKTDWYYKEIETALERQKAEGKIRIIPAINVRPEFDETQFKELSKLQDVAYLSLGKEDFRKNLLKMVGVDSTTAPRKSSAPTVINNISYPENLIPRRDMLNKLDKEFKSHKCVVVSGIGGSGKTSLAYLYAKEQNFNNIAWVIVNGKIEDVFVDKIAGLLLTEKDDYERFSRISDATQKLDFIKSELSKIQGNNLLVFDINTNTEEIKQEIETKISNYLPSGSWKTLVLTRTVAENPSRFSTIKMDKMAADDAQKLFLNNWTRTKIVFSQDQLAEITKELYYHPLLIEQTAIVFSKGHEKSAEEIISKIKENSKVNNPRTKKILSGLAIEDKEQQDIYTYLINLCNIENLSPDEINFLAVYVTWPEEPIDYEVISTLLPDTDEQLDSLVEKGIISRNDADQFSIHSLMADVIREQINIREFDYTEYLDNIDKILDDDIKSVALDSYSKCIASSFINYGICGRIVLFINFLNQLLDNNDVILYQLPMPELYNLANAFEENAEPYYLAELYNAIAKVEYFKNNLSDAKMHFEKALEVIANAEENDENLGAKGALLQNLAHLEANLCDTESAKTHYEEAVEIFRKLPETPKYLNNLATTLGNFAGLEEKLGETDSAKKHLEEAIEIFKKLPETPGYLDLLAKAINNLATLEEKLGDTDSAKTHYEEAVEVNRKLLELTETPKYLDSLAVPLHNLADLEENLGDTDSAKTHYEEAVDIRRQLPETPMYLGNLTNSLARLATVEVELGDINSAKKHLEEGLEISRRSGNEKYIKIFEKALSLFP